MAFQTEDQRRRRAWPHIAAFRLGARFRLVFHAHQALGFSKQNRQNPEDDRKHAKLLDHLIVPVGERLTGTHAE